MEARTSSEMPSSWDKTDLSRSCHTPRSRPERSESAVRMKHGKAYTCMKEIVDVLLESNNNTAAAYEMVRTEDVCANEPAPRRRS